MHDILSSEARNRAGRVPVAIVDKEAIPESEALISLFSSETFVLVFYSSQLRYEWYQFLWSTP